MRLFNVFVIIVNVNGIFSTIASPIVINGSIFESASLISCHSNVMCDEWDAAQWRLNQKCCYTRWLFSRFHKFFFWTWAKMKKNRAQHLPTASILPRKLVGNNNRRTRHVYDCIAFRRAKFLFDLVHAVIALIILAMRTKNDEYEKVFSAREKLRARCAPTTLISHRSFHRFASDFIVWILFEFLCAKHQQ